MSDPIHAIVHLRAEGVSVLVDLTAGRLPSILHWGDDLGALDADDAPALLASAIRPLASNIVDPPIRVALLPEHRTGWLGRPGLSGSRARARLVAGLPRHPGRAGRPQIEPTADLSLVSAGSGTLMVEAADDAAQLRLEAADRAHPRRTAPDPGAGDQPGRRGVHRE